MALQWRYYLFKPTLFMVLYLYVLDIFHTCVKPAALLITCTFLCQTVILTPSVVVHLADYEVANILKYMSTSTGTLKFHEYAGDNLAMKI